MVRDNNIETIEERFMVRDNQSNFDSVMNPKSEELLLSVGVSKKKAMALAYHYTLRQVYNMVKYAQDKGKNPAGMVIRGLEEGWSRIPDVLTPEMQSALIQEKAIPNTILSVSPSEKAARIKKLNEKVEEMKRQEALNQKEGD